MQVFEIKSDEPIQNGRECPKSDESSDSELQYPKSNINYHLLTMKLEFYFRNYFDALEGVVSRFY